MDFDKILIVDDSETSRLIIRRCFEIAGFDSFLPIVATVDDALQSF